MQKINLLYYLFILVCISTFSLLRFLTLDIPIWYFSYSLTQGFLEVGIFVFFAMLLKSRPWLFRFYLTTLFVILILHYTQFTLLRLMDSPLSLFFKFFLGKDLQHMIRVFQAINMNQSMLLLIGSVILLIPLIAIFLYRVTDFIKVKISYSQIGIALICLSVFLFLFECILIRPMPYLMHAKYEKTLSLGTTLFSPNVPKVKARISPPRDQEKIIKHFENCTLSKKPNIYLFVIETLRKDFITEEIAPTLTSFGRENIQFPNSFANANSTQHSWFAIFHSLLPIHSAEFPKFWNQGSAPLHILKNLGYKIHVYSSADLRYFEMDEILFGQKQSLVHQIEEYANRPIASWEKDALVMQAFEKNKEKEGNVFLFFLDATHSEYSFPENGCIFKPIVKKIDYLIVNPKKSEAIVNRYRNAVHYIDSLIGQFIHKLKDENIFDDAIIAITGDHGEEFFEEGSLFHGTHLNDEQTSVPIFFKFPDNKLSVETKTATHIDIFPSILDYLTSINAFEGKSIFRKRDSPYHLAFLQNGAKAPNEFTIRKEGYKLHARFTDSQNLYAEHEFEILECSGFKK